jgi:hypothetical protein
MINQPINDGGPAFPTTATATTVSKQNDGDSVLTNYGSSPGMTLRQYAAIKLRVPDSETDWLDDMIRKSNRDYFAAKALQGSLACLGSGGDWDDFAKDAYKYADAMLKARGEAK